MKRYLSVWFPEWPLDRLRRTRRRAARLASPAERSEPKAFALYEKSAHGNCIAAANLAARSHGIHPGLRLSDALATFPALIVEEIDRESDARALRGLAAWMLRFSPLVAWEGDDGLILETTGCDHLFGGEAGLAAELSRRLNQAGYGHRLAFASTRGAAYALSHTASEQDKPAFLKSGEEREGLASLPAGALRLTENTLALLRRFGLTRIGQLYAIDRKALARRFNSRDATEAVCLRLDQALGLRAEPFKPFHPPPDHVVRLPCPDPLTAGAGIQTGLERLAELLCAQLAARGAGGQSFVFRAFRSDGEVCSLRVNAARPVRAAAHIVRLFGEKTEQIDPGFGIDLLLLEAFRIGPMETGSRPLSGELAQTDTDMAALAALADRINARLGEGCVTVSVPLAHHPVDPAEERISFAGEIPPGSVSPAASDGLRPIRMLYRPERVDVIAEVPDAPPLRFVWRKIARRVVRADGPERIAPEWWTYLPPARGIKGNPPRTRDYYRVEDAEGRRYWLFREGLYDDGRGMPPEWFVQGLFA